MIKLSIKGERLQDTTFQISQQNHAVAQNHRLFQRKKIWAADLVEKLGLAFVPEKTWGKSFSQGEFELRPVLDLPIKRYVYVVWNEGFLRENVRQCIHCIEDFFEYCK